MRNKILLSALLASAVATSVSAQDAGCHNFACLKSDQTIPKFYVGSAFDAAIFSTATIHHDAIVYDPSGASIAAQDKMGTLRFTYFVNIGATFNFNVSKHVGVFTGIDMKNVGYIEQDNGYTLKRRTYNVGAPLALKFGNMHMKGSYFFVGGGVDFPFNFQEKYFKDRDNKKRINEWFSDRTPNVMPYVMAGMSFHHGISVKVQYYPNNFLNTDYVNGDGIRPYTGTEVHLLLFSVGFGMHSMHMSMGHHKKCTQRNMVREYGKPGGMEESCCHKD